MARPLLDCFIFMSRHVLLTGSALFLILVVAGPALGLDRRFRHACRNHGWWLVHLPTLLCLALFVGVGYWYLRLQGYAGEVEPMISSVSWLINQGQPLYHEINSPSRYSVLYGPSVYLTDGLFLQFLGSNISISKLPSLLAGFLSLVFLYGALARSKKDVLSVLAVLMAILLYWMQGFSIYLVRPDAFLVFSVSFALMGLKRTKGLLGVLVLGAAMGYAINLKIHAGIYFLPVLVLFQQRSGWRNLLYSLTIAVLLVMAPFLLHPQISATNYVMWLKNALGHGLCDAAVADTIRYAGVLLLPLVLVTLLEGRPRQTLKRDRSLFLSLIVSLVGVLVLSAKPGAGLVHLLPLVPVMIFVATSRAQVLNHSHWFSSNELCGRLLMARTGILAFVIVVIMSGTVNLYRSCCLVAWENRNSGDLALDIESILEDYTGVKISMACGGEDEFFRNTWMRPLLVFADNPVLIDPIAVMDCRRAGVEISDDTFKAIKNGEVGMWLVPKNQKPFQKTNWYAPHDEIFPERFLDYFAEHYSPMAHTKFFDLWVWNGLEMELKGQGNVVIGGAGMEEMDGKLAK